MKQFLSIGLISLASISLLSCGTGKKLTAANNLNAELTNQLNTANAALADKDKQISQLKEADMAHAKAAADCQVAKDAAVAKLTKLENDLEAEGKAIDAIMEKAESAIQKLVDAGAEVGEEDGNVLVSMPDKFLFKTGSATVGAKGKEGLAVIAEIMQEYPNTKAIVIGNTDTTHVKGKADNWSLSTERANAVVRILHETYNINPARLTAAGKSKFNPGWTR